MDMDQFRVCYVPGGMTLSHSGWFLCHRVLLGGIYVDLPIKFLKRADYK
jgi:hypothetical protein